MEMKKNDAELHTLIKSSRILEQFAAEQLDGVERRRHQRDQLVNLGIQVPFPLLHMRLVFLLCAKKATNGDMDKDKKSISTNVFFFCFEIIEKAGCEGASPD